jgi:hypothetical protein
MAELFLFNYFLDVVNYRKLQFLGYKLYDNFFLRCHRVYSHLLNIALFFFKEHNVSIKANVSKLNLGLL